MGSGTALSEVNVFLKDLLKLEGRERVDLFRRIAKEVCEEEGVNAVDGQVSALRMFKAAGVGGILTAEIKSAELDCLRRWKEATASKLAAEQLRLRSLPEGNLAEAMRWVVANWFCYSADADVEVFPSRVSHAIWRRSHMSSGAEAVLWKEAISRLLPSRAALDAMEGSMSQESEECLDVIEHLKHMRRDKGVGVGSA